MESASIEDVLEVIGFGPVQMFMLFACAMSGIYVLLEFMGIGTVGLTILCDFSKMETEFSMLTSAIFFGVVLSSHFFGYQTDKIGRRKVMLISLSLAMLSSLLSVTMPYFYLLLLGRFVTGIFISGAGINSLTYITEYTHGTLHPRIATALSLSMACGALIAPVLGHFLSPLLRVLFTVDTINYRVWRVNLLLHLIPGLIGFISMALLPESAKFLLSVGRGTSAYQILNRLCLRNRKKDLQSLGVNMIYLATPRASLATSQNCFLRLYHDTADLLIGPYLRNFMLTTTMICGFCFVGQGLALWFTKFSQNWPKSELILCDLIQYTIIGNASDPASVCWNQPHKYTDGIKLGFMSVLMCIIMNLALFCMTRPMILFCSAAFASISALCLNAVTTRWVMTLALMLLITLCLNSVVLANSVMIDVVPTHLRGKALSLSNVFSRLSVIIATHSIGQLSRTFCMILFNIIIIVTVMVATLACVIPKKDYVLN